VDAGEEVRLRALHSLGILGTPREERFDRIARLARRLFDASGAAVNFIAEDRQWTKAESGLEGLVAVPLGESMCARTVRSGVLTVIEDAAEDAEFCDGMFVADGVRFYAGCPIDSGDGVVVGTLCIVDTVPRTFDDRDRAALADLAALAEREIGLSGELRRAGEVQQMLMPSLALEVPGYEMAGRCVASQDIGGDFFAWQLLSTGEIQLHLADVMGHGIPAALVAASLRAVLLGASQFNTLRDTMGKVADATGQLFEDSASFATLHSVRVHPETGTMEYVDAGHGLAFILDLQGGLRRLATSGPPLGLLPDAAWEPRAEHLAPGETLVVVSDGLLDLFPSLEEAVAKVLRKRVADGSVRELVDRVIAFSERRGHDDDVTVLALRRLPSAGEAAARQ
jgi:hypothetical protein